MRIHFSFRTLLAPLLCLPLLFPVFSCGGPAEESAPQSESASSEVSEMSSSQSGQKARGNVVFRMAVASDVHISTAGDETASRLKFLFSSAYRYAESQPYGRLDAAVFVGDLTNYGREDEWRAVTKIADGAKKEETELLFTMGNHEYYQGGEAAFKKVVSPDLNFHKTINGIHLIGLSANGDNLYSKETLSFLETSLKEASKDGEDKPIFVFQHHHLQNTVYVAAEWYANDSPAFFSLLKNYPQVIDFSGHSHAPVNHPDSIWQREFTCVGTGTLAYFELLSGMTDGTIPSDAGNAAQFWIVEVHENGDTVLQPYDLLTDAFFRAPATDGTDRPLVYEVSPSAGTEGFLYTNEKKRSTGEAPEFRPEDVLTVTDVTEVSATVRIPTASSDSCLYGYNLKAVPESGSAGAKNYACFAPFYIEPFPSSVSYRMTGLEPDTTYSLTVAPFDWALRTGKRISVSFRTEKKPESAYVPASSLTFLGTCADFEKTSTLMKSSSTFAYGGTPNGDVFAGDWMSGSQMPGTKFGVAEGKGWNGSRALEISSSVSENRGLYLFPNQRNGFSSEFKDPAYLRVWADFTEIEFRKANFGLVSPDGCLYTTDEKDYVPDLYFWYLPEGGNEWVRMKHGSDGCFGAAESAPVGGCKGWFAFPLSDFGYRAGTGAKTPSETARYPETKIAGIYLFWDYDKTSDLTGKPFYLDEFHLVEDYTVFENAENAEH
ncbi:MAG: metallophosphoesterase [Clostridia bacterium]|nr:metallophosphoesterase [Clostridia bacterium]